MKTNHPEIDNEDERFRLPANRPNTVLIAIMLLSAVWLLAMAISIWRTNVEQSGVKALVMLGVAGLFLGGWTIAYLNWSRRRSGRN